MGNLKLTKVYLMILSLLGWFSLIAQFYITVDNRSISLVQTIIRFFSYFTIDTNFLVAICSAILVLIPKSKIGNFFNRQTTLTAITVYIVVVGIIYNFNLRALGTPIGLLILLNELMHLIIPLLFFIFWLVSVPKNLLKWKDFWTWLIYPLLYIIIILLLGSNSNFYPYPFINVNEIGTNQTLINSLIIALLFAGLSLLFITFSKLVAKK